MKSCLSMKVLQISQPLVVEEDRWWRFWKCLQKDGKLPMSYYNFEHMTMISFHFRC